FQEIAARYGRLDILVLNAARAPFKNVGELLRRDLLELVENNYLGNVYCMQQALPLMQGIPGHVVFVSSLGSRFALPSYPLGSMKPAMEALVKQLAAELGDRQITGTRVTAGVLKTDSLIASRQYWPGAARRHCVPLPLIGRAPRDSRPGDRRRHRPHHPARAAGVLRLAAETRGGGGYEARIAESLISSEEVFREAQKALAAALQIYD